MCFESIKVAVHATIEFVCPAALALYFKTPTRVLMNSPKSSVRDTGLIMQLSTAACPNGAPRLRHQSRSSMTLKVCWHVIDQVKAPFPPVSELDPAAPEEAPPR